MLSTILIIILILLLIGALPTWPYSAGWGYGPGGVLGLILNHHHHSGAAWAALGVCCGSSAKISVGISADPAGI